MAFKPVRPEDATLLDILIDGFAGGQGAQEVVHGWRERGLPMPSPEAAVTMYFKLVEQARRLLGREEHDVATVPADALEPRMNRCTSWDGLRIAQVGSGIGILVRYPDFDAWWTAAHKNGVGRDVYAALQFAHEDAAPAGQAGEGEE